MYLSSLTAAQQLYSSYRMMLGTAQQHPILVQHCPSTASAALCIRAGAVYTVHGAQSTQLSHMSMLVLYTAVPLFRLVLYKAQGSTFLHSSTAPGRRCASEKSECYGYSKVRIFVLIIRILLF